MQNTSQHWKNNQKEQIVSESFVELMYEVGDPDSLADASASDNGSIYFANTPIIVNEVDESMVKYATFEQGLWRLDGSCRLLPVEAPYTGTGYVSNILCDDNGVFVTNPVITVSFNRVYSKVIPGITIRWGHVYEDYADTFIVTAYNDDTEVASKTITDNTDSLSQVLLDIMGYNKITVEIVKWANPNRRARIEEIFIGIKRVFGKSDLMSYTHTMSVDPLSFELPKASIDFELSNVEDEFNPFNPDNHSKYMIERQRIVARYGYRIDNAIEWIKAGGFYLSEWGTPQNGITASFVARDLLEFMTDRYVGTIENISLYDIAVSALTQANLPLNRDGSLKWVVDPSLQSIIIPYAELDEDITIAEVLQLVANAGCCVMYQDRNEKLRIEPLSLVLSDYVISPSNSYANADLELSRILKAVNVNEGMAVVENNTEGVTQEIENVLITPAQAPAVGLWVKEFLKNRAVFKGEFRADPRLDALDMITVKNKYVTKPVLVTDIEYSYNGAFRGRYKGRVIA